MVAQFPESHKIVNCGNSAFIAASEDIFNGSPATDVLSLANYFECTFFIQKNAGAVGTATITVYSCDDAVPTTATLINFYYRYATSADTYSAWTLTSSTAGFTTTAGANQVYEIYVNSDMLATSSTTYKNDSFVKMLCTEVADGACDGGIMAILTSPRFAESENAPTVLA